MQISGRLLPIAFSIKGIFKWAIISCGCLSKLVSSFPSILFWSHGFWLITWKMSVLIMCWHWSPFYVTSTLYLVGRRVLFIQYLNPLSVFLPPVSWCFHSLDLFGNMIWDDMKPRKKWCITGASKSNCSVVLVSQFSPSFVSESL